MPILRTPHSSAALTILNLVALALQRISTALPRVWAEFPLLPFDLSQEDERQAQFSTNGMPARSLTSSNRERNAPSISSMEQDGTHFLNSLSEKYLLIVYRLLFESAYMYYLWHYSKLTELLYKKYFMYRILTISILLAIFQARWGTPSLMYHTDIHLVLSLLAI